MPMFDPNQAMPDFAAQEQSAQQQRILADLLRKKALASQQPEGRMVGRQYVNPHWLQRLVPLADAANAGWAGNQATQAEQDVSNQQSQAANQWRSSLPQATAATPFVPGSPDVPGQDGGQAAAPAQPEVPVDRNAILKYTLAGMNNPRTAKEAMLVNQSLTSDLTRTEDQAFKKETKAEEQAYRAEEAAKTRAHQLEVKREQLDFQEKQLAQQFELAKGNREQQLVIAKMLDETRRQGQVLGNEAAMARVEIARLTAETAKGTKDAAKATADEKDLNRNVAKLSASAAQAAPMREAAQAINEMIASAKSPNDIAGLGAEGYLHPRLRTKDANTNIQKIALFNNAVTRAQAGLSQTLSEQQKVDLETMAKAEYTPAEFVAAWPENMKKLNAILANIRAGAPDEAHVEYRRRGGPDLSEIKPMLPRSALPKTTDKDRPEGMDPAKWQRLLELRAKSGGTK